MADTTSPAELISQLTKLNEKIIQYGALIISENKRLNERIELLEKEVKNLKKENHNLRKGIVDFSQN
ncbi:MAG: hypothetical protein SCALA702_23040 [Melioribacteraceae bacterium]|nr:MAG: hypothetical protein SCALA702_23040 [Melioribacteraceae bacterium]